MSDEIAMVMEEIREPKGSVDSRNLTDVAQPIVVLDPGMLVSDFEVMFRNQKLTAVAVEDIGENRIGLITGTHFARAMTGRLGFGRPVLLRKSIGELANWAPLVLPAQTSVAEAATKAMQRTGEHRYDHVLVADALWKVAEAADLTMALVTTIARKSAQDAVTGLPARASTWREVERRCNKAKRGNARIVLVLVGIDGIDQVNAKYGQNAGDAVIRKVAQRLATLRQPGAFIGRVTGRQFAVVATISDDNEITTAARVELLAQHYATGLRLPDSSLPADVWPRAVAGAAWTGASLSSSDVLIHNAEVRLRLARTTPVAEGSRIEQATTNQHDRKDSRFVTTG